VLRLKHDEDGQASFARQSETRFDTREAGFLFARAGKGG
jgi:hypothetical protein